MKALPGTPEDIVDILVNFYDNCQRQSSFTTGKLPIVDDLKKKGILESLIFSFTSRYFRPNSPVDLTERDIYLYAKVKGVDTPLPIDGKLTEIVETHDIRQPVCVDGKLYYSFYSVSRTKDKITIKIGQSTVLTYSKGCKSIGFKYIPSNMLRILAKDGMFFIAAIRHGEITIGENRFVVNIGKQKINIAEQASIYEKYVRFVQMLDAQSCVDDVDISRFTNVDFENMERLALATLDNKPISGLRHDIQTLTTLSIGTLIFALWMEQDDKDKSSYIIRNAMDYSIPSYPSKEGLIEIPNSTMFSKEHFVSVSNIRFSQMLTSFKKYATNSYICSIANEVMLRLISAYDDAVDQRKQVLYDTALSFAEWLCSMPDSVWDKRIGVLNLLQLKKRRRELSESEKDELSEMIEQSTDKEEILTGAYLLLDQQKQAQRHFSKLPHDDQKALQGYPITKYFSW